jgi:hypothetical protein
MGCRLVLVRWYGDVVATRTLAPGEAPDRALEEAGNGVSLDVIDVAYTRSSLSLHPVFNLAPVFGLLASIAFHSVIGMMVKAYEATPQEEAKARDAALYAYTLQIDGTSPQDTAPNLADLGFAQPEPPPAATPPEQAPNPALCTRAEVPQASGPMCTERVTVTSISRSSPSCFTDTVVQGGEAGLLTFPCSGDGPVSLHIGSAQFVGAQIDGKLEACTGTEFAWSDGCTWTSAQRVSGKAGSGHLVFTYGEAPKPGQRQCASACTAKAAILFGDL